MRLTQANSKLENVPRIPHVSQVTSANGKVRSPQSAARKQSKNKLFSIGCFPFLKAHRGITTTTYFTLHILQRHLQNPGGATSSLPVRRQIAGSEDAAPPMHEVLQTPLKNMVLLGFKPCHRSTDGFVASMLDVMV